MICEKVQEIVAIRRPKMKNIKKISLPFQLSPPLPTRLNQSLLEYKMEFISNKLLQSRLQLSLK